MDYIYQGPIILVLLVGPQWWLGWGWVTGGQRRVHPGRDSGKDVAWVALHTYSICHSHTLSVPPYAPAPPNLPFLTLDALAQPHTTLVTSGLFLWEEKGSNG